MNVQGSRDQDDGLGAGNSGVVIFSEAGVDGDQDDEDHFNANHQLFWDDEFSNPKASTGNIASSEESPSELDDSDDSSNPAVSK